MTEGSVTDIILSRAQTADRLNGMIVWSVAAHIALFIFMIFIWMRTLQQQYYDDLNSRHR